MATSSPKPSPPPPRPSKSQALDDLIMGTNSSSIVSKRSVERLYYPDEAHFFRYFVNKFQRRAPLINRGYWLRLRAIDVVVHQFLKSSPSNHKKVVINLGCGSACENTVFLDIDYPDLMRKKRAIVLGTPQLPEFCLLEQILPNGPDHPFARTMLKHFNKLNTPLKSVHQYPTLESQRVRFQERGWQSVDLWDLWEAWNSEEFLSSTEKIALDDTEPFDEWEEFVLFARHYFVMHAKASPKISASSQDRAQQDTRCSSVVEINRHDSVAPKRRFGAPMVVANPEGQRYAMHTFGMGTNGRVASYDVYTLEGATVPLEMSPVGPSARMCHTVTDLGDFGFLLSGGRASPSSVFSDSWIFKKGSKCWEKTGDLPTPLFRHAAVRLRGSALALVFGGKVGISQVSPDYFLFHPIMGWLRCTTSGTVPDPIFGAVALTSSEESQNSSKLFRGLLSGGMTQDGTINTKAYQWKLDITGAMPSLNFEILEDLGSQANDLSVFGAQVVECGPFSYVDSPKVTHSSAGLVERTHTAAKATTTTIPRVRLNSDSDFQEVLRNRKPVIIEGLNLGQCMENWTPEYMVQCLGEKKEVVVHECQLDTEKMDFNSKNFRYVTETFGTFMDKVKLGQRLYLRSLSEQNPSESPANINIDFPALADECSLPEELRYVTENLFSSVLRISGRVNMWLHYDVMANVYTQIRGSKRMVLFPPTDVSHLAFAPGASSSSLDVFSALEKHHLAATHPHDAVLGPGDVLFLPPMWFHTASPTTNMSVAVNFFFRDLHSGYSSGRDVYGNRDLAAYEKGRQDVARLAKGFDQLPPEIRQFYLARLADELLHQQT
ncbi:hypothetical protein G7Z17_g8218 [Cylindrodendrum hubeiense]|uniref:tRNA wybutosine-synthesizing protein 4 n=1 Tax=Cylindrodendrum hubeiense TaxID=595255 RepID=A0A9P5H6B9_9HYPO|nr:hypothetical protein G7Z17_g8218 [Cylindrodendrum hubeiense]